VVVHTVGFCIDEDHVLNQPGRTYYTAASNPDELRQGLQAVLAEAPNFDATKFN
jgi:Ca-activated chloride channel family protein